MDNKMSDERIEYLNQMTLVIGGSLCGFVFLCLMAMVAVGIYYNKKGI
jgi:hypothetical protein